MRWKFQRPLGYKDFESNMKFFISFLFPAGVNSIRANTERVTLIHQRKRKRRGCFFWRKGRLLHERGNDRPPTSYSPRHADPRLLAFNALLNLVKVAASFPKDVRCASAEERQSSAGRKKNLDSNSSDCQLWFCSRPFTIGANLFQ